MDFSKLKKVNFKDIKDGFVHLVMTTKIEVVIGAFAISALGGIMAYDHQAGKAGQIPLAFSEISATKLRLKNNGQKMSAMTRFNASANDYYMKIFEANNLSYDHGNGSPRDFAEQLALKLNSSGVSRTSLQDYAMDFPQIASKAREALKKTGALGEDLKPVVRLLDEAWSEHHRKVTKEVCSGTGEDETCDDVYSHTDHSYYFNEESGFKSAAALARTAHTHPELEPRDSITLAGATKEQNRKAMRDSRPYLDEEPTDDQYLEWTNTYAFGSNYYIYIQDILGLHTQLDDHAKAWGRDVQTAETYHETTYFEYGDNPDPKEFVTAERAYNLTSELSGKIAKIMDGIDYADENVRDLYEKVYRLVRIYEFGTPRDNKKDEARELAEQILEGAKEGYQKNFAGGFDVDTFKWWPILLTMGLGLVAGGGLGIGADRYIDKKSKKQQRAGGFRRF